MMSAIVRRKQPRGIAKAYALLNIKFMGVCTQGQMGSADPPEKMDEKLKSENVQKIAIFYVYVIF